MNYAIIAYSQLQESESVRLEDGKMVFFAELSTVVPIWGLNTITNGMDHVYCTQKNLIAYIDNGKYFVTPKTNKTIGILEENGFSASYFHVPLAELDYPIEEQEKWSNLLKDAELKRTVEFDVMCRTFCESKGVKGISEETLKNCFVIPEEGVEVIYGNSSFSCLPVITGNNFDFWVANKLGRYAYSKGIVAFVYKDGKTYVTRGYDIIDELVAAGYVEDKFYVPFTEGGEIVDQKYRELWQKVV